MASRRKNCLLLHLKKPKLTFPQLADQKINRKNKTLPGQGSNSLSLDHMSTALPTELQEVLVKIYEIQINENLSFLECIG